MSHTILEVRDGRCIIEHGCVVSPSLKRDFSMINKDGIQYAISTTAKEARSEDGKTRKPKKFRTEWMEEEHLKDWLQPYPEDDTMCICTACDIVLRCGKSELEKHATGLKHTKKVEEMKVYCLQDGEDSETHPLSNDQSARLEDLLSRDDDQVWIPVTSRAELTLEDEIEEEVIDENDPIGLIRPHQKERSACNAKLTEALVKLFEFADGKVDLSRKRLEMLQEEHALKLQILEKELRLKTLEVEIKETELRKLRLETMQSAIRDSQIPQNTQLTINDHQLHVISDQQLQEALQTHLQHFQSQFEHHQNQEKLNGSQTS